MRIVQIIATIGPANGGPSIGSVALNRAFRRAGAEAYLLTTSTSGREGGVLSIEDREKLGTEWTRYFEPSRPHAAEASTGMKSAIPEYVRWADVVHVHGTYRAPTYYACRSAIAASKPYVIQPHGTFETFQRALHGAPKRIYDAFAGDRFVRNASGIVLASVSELTNSYHPIPAEKAIVVPLGVEEAQPIRPADIGEWLDRAPGIKVVVYIGRYATKKHPDMVVSAWSRLPAAVRGEARLVLAGPDGDWSEVQINTLIAQKGIADSARAFGSLTRGEVSWLLGRADIYTLPSDNENFGLSIAEAMSQGCFVITGSGAAVSVDVNLAQSGTILDTITETDLMTAISDSLTDPDSSRSAGERGRAYARRRFSWDRTANDLISHYRAML